ncbi:MAG: glycosyltransferase family 2 protein [Lachnospiraceae bacterium]|jgi:GT2 family glycosyltransferase|nr:glycosyltransferase family 2 protein [Lachnospiraceae bacterium]
MSDVSIVIPNYNGISCLGACLRSVSEQPGVSAEVIVVDNGSTDGSREYIREHFQECVLICLDRNYGFCRAVNEGIRRADSPYVILLNNDTEVQPDFARQLLYAIREDADRFSCAAQMLQYGERTLLDNAGDFYCALGWGIADGRGKPAGRYPVGREIFSSCAGAAIYRKELLEELGGFDEAHFAYLEDMDLSWRAKIHGYYHWYVPQAKVFHIGSATSGSRHNAFKVLHSAGNNVYLIYKNMPFLQILLNAPLLLAGFGIKYLFFAGKGLGRAYRQGLMRGFRLCAGHPDRRIRPCMGHVPAYLKIQLELWKNILLFLPWL